MSAKPIRLLVVEDEASAAEALAAAFGGEGYEVALASTGGEARERFAEGPWDCILTDVVMPDVNGLDLLQEWVKEPEAPPVIVMTAYASVERAVQAMKDGAFDFQEKPLDLDNLRAVVRSAVDQRRGEPENRPVRAKLESESHRLVLGKSPAMHKVVEQAQRVARTNATVLIVGESGTGKELLARLIHRESLRVRGPLVPVN